MYGEQRVNLFIPLQSGNQTKRGREDRTKEDLRRLDVTGKRQRA